MKLLFILLLNVIILFSYVNANGYSLWPPSRQTMCYFNPNNNVWWPDDGSGTGIKDTSCRAAYKEVFVKEHNHLQSLEQFTRFDTYAVSIPDYDQPNALKDKVPGYICSAGAYNPLDEYGDKSGMSIVENWKTTPIKAANVVNNSVVIDYFWCATSMEDSFWQFYVTKESFNPREQPLTWDDLELIDEKLNLHVITTRKYIDCRGMGVIKTQIPLPIRTKPAILVVRKQKEDAKGECFINCSDFIMEW